MKKANKAAAQDWNDEQRFAQQLQAQFEDEKNLLWYAAYKRKTGYPSAEVFRNAGYTGVAAKICHAYSLLDDAYSLLEQN